MTNLNFIDRVQVGSAADFIDLREQEKEHYRGAGYALAAVDETGNVTGITYLHNVDDIQTTLNEAVAAENQWLVMCSSYQLCDPRLVHSGDPVGVARVARLHAEEFDI